MVLHILFNMMWLWDLGGMIEKQQSSQFLIFFVISIGILSNIIQYLSSGPAFGGSEWAVFVAALAPGDAEARVRGADDA